MGGSTREAGRPGRPAARTLTRRAWPASLTAIAVGIVILLVAPTGIAAASAGPATRGPIQAVASAYSAAFNSTGLPTGATWWVDLTNSSQSLNDNVTAVAPAGIEFNESNGTYNWTAGEVGLYLPSPGSGNATINGTNVSVAVTFVPPPMYAVTFLERGLPSGTAWGANVSTNWGDYSNSSAASSFLLYLPNGSSDSVAPFSVSGYFVPDSIPFSVSGNARTVDVNYTAGYGIRFVESGLEGGATWAVSLRGTAGTVYSGYSSTSNDTNYFAAANGTYDFTIEPVYSYTSNVTTGRFVVSGTNVSVPVTFAPSTRYGVVFHASGLVPGTNWSVTVYLPNLTSQVATSTGAAITFLEPNGTTYSYATSAAGYQTNTSQIPFRVSGGNVSISVPFTELFPITFVESGLPTGTGWQVSLNSTAGSSYADTIAFEVPNGTYPFTARAVGSFAPFPPNGHIHVHGGAVIQDVIYSSPTTPTYLVGFNETGLPLGTNWTVTLDGQTLWSVGSWVNFTEANGSFSFDVPNAAGETATPGTGSLTVSGANLSQSILFAVPVGSFNVTFAESSLPNGSRWYVNISGEPSLTAAVNGTFGTQVTIFLPNASYSYVAVTTLPAWSGPVGDFSVRGVAETIGVPFSHAGSISQVSFSESGLPDGSTWFVNITGEPSLAATVLGTSGTTVSINLGNGSYTFTAATLAGGFSTASVVTFNVSGRPVSEQVVFARIFLYAVTFSESGLPPGATWYLNVSGQSPLVATVNISGIAQLSLSLPNGTYAYTTATNWKNWTTTSAGTVSVAGSPVGVATTFSSSTPSPPGPTPPYVWVGIAILVIVIGLVLALAMSRSREQQKPPPEPDGRDTTLYPEAPPPRSGGS
jgi:hypothetical protein